MKPQEPSINLIKYINVLNPHTSIQNDELIIVTNLKFLDNLVKLLKSTPKRVLANFIM